MTHAPAARKRQVDQPDGHNDDEDCSLQPTPPDGGWGWVVVFASFMIHIVTDGVTYSFGVFFAEFLKYFDSGNGETALIASILVGVTLCSGPVTSSFVNKFGCRPVTIAGAILASISLGLSVLAPSVLTLYFTIGIGAGLGFGLIYLPAIVSVTCYFEKYRSLATGIAVCGSGLGTFVLAPLTEKLIATLEWRNAMLIIALLVLSCVIFGALFRPLDLPEPEDVELQMEILLDRAYEMDRQNHSEMLASLERKDEEIENVLHQMLPPVKADITPHPTVCKTNLVLDTSRTNSSSEHNIHSAVANGSIHRPHSISHLSSSRPIKSPPSKDTGRLARSQPVLMASIAGEHKIAFGSQNLRRKSSGVMYRKDVFYRGSLHNIPHHHRSSSQWLPTDLVPPEERQLVQQTSSSIQVPEQVTMCGCVPCSRETADTLSEMLDFSLLKDPIFVLFTLSNFCTSIGFNVPYVYITVQAESRGIQADHASYLLAAIGIANTVGRIILGYVSDKTWVNRLLVYNACLTICGVATAFSALCYDFITFTVYASVFGFTIGAYVGLTSVILVDLLGLEKLTNAFGLLLLFQGIASLIGPPIAGLLYDALKSYDPGFIVAGVMMAISGLILFAIPPLQRRAEHKQKMAQNLNGSVIIASP